MAPSYSTSDMISIFIAPLQSYVTCNIYSYGPIPELEKPQFPIFNSSDSDSLPSEYSPGKSESGSPKSGSTMTLSWISDKKTQPCRLRIHGRRFQPYIQA
jgi:hypothetical protein